MKLSKYKKLMREKRGSLKGCDDMMRTIFECGSDNMIRWSHVNKRIGIEKMAIICENLNKESQDEFIIWIEETPNINAMAISLKLVGFSDANL